jgi:molybdopterin-guanine dinucleotide biosynthesis protein
MRQPIFIIIVGTNGTGKTTLLHKMIKKTGRRSLIVDPDGYEWRNLPTVEISEILEVNKRLKKGKAVKIVGPEAEDIKLLDKYTKGNLVLDDCRYYTDSRLDKDMRKLFIRRRQKEIDIFAVSHSLVDVPPGFFTYATHVIMFKTADNPDRVKKNIPNYSEMMQMIKRVNSSKNAHYFEEFSLK